MRVVSSLTLISVVLLVPSCVFGQFKSLAEKESAKDKLDDFFVQADSIDSYAVSLRSRHVLVNEVSGKVRESSLVGMTIRSLKHKLDYFCTKYEGVFNPPLPYRAETLLIQGVERRRSEAFVVGSNLMKKASTIEPNAESGLRADLVDGTFAYLGVEVDPFGFILTTRVPSYGRNTNLRDVLRIWVTRLDLKSEKETNGMIVSN